MMQTDNHMRAVGACLCGAVSYEVHGALRPVIYCHCSQCRITSGHFVAATATLKQDLRLIEDKGLEWYQSSEMAKRGFCKICGSSLFWIPEEGEHVSIMTGTLDLPTGISAAEHIYVENKGDYYELGDDLPQHLQGGQQTTMIDAC